MKKVSRLLPVLCCVMIHVVRAQSPDTLLTFGGEKTAWHEGFDRYDFLMDEQTFALTPIRATAEEKLGASAEPKGKIRYIVVVPQKPAVGNPWTWRGCH